MSRKVLCSILLISLAVLNRVNVIQAGGSPHDICAIYVDTFEIIYNQTVSSLTQALQDGNQTLYSIDTDLPHVVYIDQIQMITDFWYADNLPTFEAAVSAAASLTGTASEDIFTLINAMEPHSEPPLSCLYEMLIELHKIFTSYSNAIASIGQFLSDGQYNVGFARPV